jgi:hypothetical protein
MHSLNGSSEVLTVLFALKCSKVKLDRYDVLFTNNLKDILEIIFWLQKSDISSSYHLLFFKLIALLILFHAIRIRPS